MYKKEKTQRGITLIALIITIIVMLILVSVTISMAVNGGLFDYAGKAAGDTKNAIQAENELAKGRIQIGGVWYDSIGDYLKNKPSSNQGVTDEEVINAVGVVDNQNTITLANNLPNDTYTLKYENKNGVLQNYKEICTLTVTEDSGTRVYDDLIAENCAPVEATIIGVYNSSNERVGDIALGHLGTTLGNKFYSFGALADIHIGSSGSEEKVQNALTYLTETENVEFTCIPGDLTLKCKDTEMAIVKNIIDFYATSSPIYVSTGNHETEKHKGSEVTNEFIKGYTGYDGHYSFTQGNDIFIMINVQREEYGDVVDDEVLDWLFNTMEKNRDKRCFLFFHLYPNNSSGDPYNAYGGDLIAYEEEEFITELLDSYPNVTWFHGHSHFVFDSQEKYDSATIDTSGNFNSIHIPSLSLPRELILNEDGSYSNSNRFSTEEGYVVDVYENGIILRGFDFLAGEFFPIAQYYIDTTVEGVAALEKIEFSWIYNTYSDKETGTVGQVGADAQYSISEPIVLESTYNYKIYAGANFAWSSYIMYYAGDHSFLGAQSFAQTSAPQVGIFEIEPPNGTEYIRIRFRTDDDIQSTADKLIVYRQVK